MHFSHKMDPKSKATTSSDAQPKKQDSVPMLEEILAVLNQLVDSSGVSTAGLFQGNYSSFYF